VSSKNIAAVIIYINLDARIPSVYYMDIPSASYRAIYPEINTWLIETHFPSTNALYFYLVNRLYESFACVDVSSICFFFAIRG